MDATTLTAERPLEDIRLPGGIPELEDGPLGGGSLHAFADFFVALAPGCYSVITQPLGEDGRNSLRCGPASSSPVHVLEGRTTEIFLLHQCEGEGRGAVDVIAALNTAPSVRAVEFERSKFVLRCEEQRACATAMDPEADPLEFTWEQVSGAELNVPIEVVSSERNADGSFTECVRMVAEEPGRYEVRVSVFDTMTDPQSGQPIRFEEYFNQHGYPQPSRGALLFPFYAAQGDGGAVPPAVHPPTIQNLAAGTCLRGAGDGARAHRGGL